MLPFSFLLLFILTQPAQATKNGSSQQYVASVNATGHSPTVSYPTEKELQAYYAQQGILNKSDVFTYLSTNITGNPIEVALAAGGNITYLGFIVNQTHTIVYVSVSQNNGLNWTKPVAVSVHPLSGEASDLHMAATDIGTKGGLAWVETANGTTNVWASSTMDSGQTFRTWKLNPNNSTATDPQIVGSSVIQYAWIQHCNPPSNPLCTSGVTHHGGW